jgi:importin subunit alpha-1/8
LSKRHNVNSEQESLSLSDEAVVSSTSAFSIEEIVNHLNSSNETLQLTAIQTCRKLLSRKRDPPINDMIEAIEGSIVPLCIKFLDNDDKYV